MSPNPPTPRWLLEPALRRELAAAAKVRPARYWADLLASAGSGWVAFAGACLFTPLDGAWWALAGISALAFLRAANFVHELVHRSERELPGFHLAWMALVGVPIGVPSLMMWPHREHHRTDTFGTKDDPEFAPVPTWGRARLLGAVAIYAWIPWLLAVRWTITATFSHLHPRLRAHAVGKVSTADVWIDYVRPMPEGEEKRRFLRQELACAAFAWGALAAVGAGWLPWTVLLHRWAVMAGALMLNHARILAVHRYSGGPVDGRGQVLDAVTLGPDNPWTELVAPVGARFHALHHELPALPYHDLPRLHRLLVGRLDADHPYRQGEIPGFWAAWRGMWARAGYRPSEPPPEPPCPASSPSS